LPFWIEGPAQAPFHQIVIGDSQYSSSQNTESKLSGKEDKAARCQKRQKDPIELFKSIEKGLVFYQHSDRARNDPHSLARFDIKR